MYLTGLIFYYLINYCYSFIVPTELVSSLGLIFSNLPPTKVGIDSRFGIGFRLGPHADYQTLIEIGPQMNTNSISPNGTVAVAKRQSINGNRLQRLYNEIIRNSRREKDVPQKNSETEKKPEKSSSIGKIEFRKVPGIDDIQEVKRRNSNNSKSSKSPKTPDFPTKFILL